MFMDPPPPAGPPSSLPISTFPVLPSAPNSSSVAVLEQPNASVQGLGYGELGDRARASSAGPSTPRSASAFGRSSSMATVLEQPRTSIFFSPGSETSPTSPGMTSSFQKLDSRLGERSPQLNRSSSSNHPFAGSAFATSPHPDFSKEDQARRKEERARREQAQQASPDLALAHASTSAHPLENQSASPLVGPSSTQATGSALATPTKKAYKDPWDERTFSRTGSLNMKKDAIRAGKAPAGVSSTPDERTLQRMKSRKAVQEVVDNAILRADLTVHLNDLGLVEVPALIRDLADVVRIEQPGAAYAGLSKVIPERRFVSLAGTSSLPPPITPPSPTSPTPPPTRDPLTRRDSLGPPLADRQFARTVSMPTPRILPSEGLAAAAPISAQQQPYQGLAALRSAAAATGDASPDRPTRGLGAGRSALGRSTTVAAPRPLIPSGSTEKGKDPARRSALDQLYLGGNLLTVLPSELFQLETITFLSLTKNSLTRLPSAISRLTNLRELYIGQNAITYLPSSILTMTSLRDTVLNPNPYLRRLSPPPSASSSTTTTTTNSSKLPSHQIVYPTSRQTFLSAPRSPHAVPPLQELCLRSLIHLPSSPNPNSPATPYLKHTLEATHLRSSTALQTYLVSHEHIPSHLVPLPTCARLLAAVRSATRTIRHDFDTGGWGSGEALDDAGEDPFYSACPNPAHKERGGGERRMWVEVKGEERTEWTAVPGAGAGDLYPVRWEGCGRGCLRFLDDEEKGEDEQKGEEDCAEEVAGVEVDGQGSWGGDPPAKGKRTVGFAEAEQEEEEGDGSEDGFDIDEFGGGESAF